MGCNCTKEGVPDEEGRDVVSMSNRSASSPDPNRPDGGVEHKTKQMKEMALENLTFEPGEVEKQPGDPKPIRAMPAVPGGAILGKFTTSGGSGGNPAWANLGGAVGPSLTQTGNLASESARGQSRDKTSGRLQPRSAGEFTYEGNKKGNIRDGFGVQTYPDGSKFEGEFKKNKFHGRGEWKANQMDGYGTLYLKNGSVYVGIWKDSRKNGYGKESWDDGANFEGEYMDNNRLEYKLENYVHLHGQGTYTFPSGEVYNGGWLRNDINGWGTLDGRGGIIYQGEWKDSRFDGNGTLHFPDGSRYEGLFCQGQQEGYGVMYYFDSSCYKGGWKDGLKNGLGVLTNPKNPKLNKEGIWQQDMFMKEMDVSEQLHSGSPGNSIRQV